MKTWMKGTIAAAIVGSVATVAVANPVINQAAVNPQSVSVKQAMQMADDTKVQMKGYIVKALGDENYQFRDATGTVTVEIDDELWQGKAVSAKTLVTIQGEVDVDYTPRKKVEIDVDHVMF